MAVSLNHKDYSGWFPFAIAKDEALPTGSLARNVKLPLTSLCKAFWLAKSVDYAVDISWNGSAQIRPTPQPVSALSGSINGSGTLTMNTVSPCNRTPPPTEMPVFPMKPDGGTTTPLMSYPIVPGSATFESGDPVAIPRMTVVDWYWFYPSSNFLMSVNKAGDYLTCAYLSIGYSGTGSFGPTFLTDPAAGGSVTGVTGQIKVDGVTSPTFPIYAALTGLSSASVSASGTIVLDFNNFWS